MPYINTSQLWTLWSGCRSFHHWLIRCKKKSNNNEQSTMNCPATIWSIISDAIDYFSICNREMTAKHTLAVSEKIELTRSSHNSRSTQEMSIRQRWRIILNEDWRTNHAQGERVGFVLLFGIPIAGIPPHPPPQCRTPAIGLPFDSSLVNFTWNVWSSKYSYWSLRT